MATWLLRPLLLHHQERNVCVASNCEVEVPAYEYAQKRMQKKTARQQVKKPTTTNNNIVVCMTTTGAAAAIANTYPLPPFRKNGSKQSTTLKEQINE